MSSPSSRRREGRRSFSPGDDPTTWCPYKSGHKSEDWYDGWYQAEKEYKDNLAEQKSKDETWECLSNECPWRKIDIDRYVCAARLKGSDDMCIVDNCAPWVFVTRYEEIR